MHLASSLSMDLAGSAGPALAAVLVASLWQGPLLAAAVWLSLRVVPQARPALRHLLWTGALLVLSALPLVEHYTAAEPAQAGQAALVQIDLRWSLAAAAVWIACSLFRAGALVLHVLRLHGLLARATPIAASPSIDALLRSSRRNAHLRTSPELDRPGVLGFFSPCILIPAWLLEQLTAAELEQIVLHELEHLRRRDDWLNLLQKLALAVFPLNPALHWIDGRLCLERELACDEGVVRRTHSPRLYATCLARLAEQRLNHHSLALALGFLERQSQLACRVASILRTPRLLSPRQRLALTGGIALLLLGGSAELARCPQLISFAAAPATAAVMQATGTPAPVWAANPVSNPVLYTDAAAPYLLHTALLRHRKPVRHKMKPHPPAIPQRTAIRPASTPVILATEVPAPATLSVPTPTLVHYTLVHVDGGWLLLQL